MNYTNTSHHPTNNKSVSCHDDDYKHQYFTNGLTNEWRAKIMKEWIVEIDNKIKEKYINNKCLDSQFYL
ncbi:MULTISPECIES: hypothetical protein [Heyndrickxia]|uniref:Uncharacterized protein n=2 Tax=Heyndrickxia TaxID=2837504 RepID=A0A150KTS2_9BACI|nr:MULTISPECIES: hypothetical protein [Heyndrickxia]KYD03527.1 hypothetical protein B4102_3377 [Heyndrickxia sporothermodurans]MBL5871755.1 hypothetical protein [Heyndrickxia sporothermodurans]MED3654365.1 hypothetical protein [Heyndrickxia sporothermodurans]QQZ08771.1 hypothetical protein I5776_17325 [Heyndrickxia vini]